MSRFLSVKYILSTMTTAWLFRSFILNNIESLIENVLGLTSLLLVAYIYKKHGSRSAILWDKGGKMLLYLRPWHIEVYSARIFSSIPIGIDLSHSSAKVLEAMALHAKDWGNFELRFVVVRPMSSSSTTVGMMVIGRSSRLKGTGRALELLVKHVEIASYVLEGAMRAAYPHTPITKATLNQMMLMINGGVEIGVTC